MSMMFEDRDAYAIAESEARKAIGGLDPWHVSAERGVEFERSARAMGGALGVVAVERLIELSEDSGWPRLVHGFDGRTLEGR